MRNALVNILLAAASLAVVLAILEVVLRIYQAQLPETQFAPNTDATMDPAGHVVRDMAAHEVHERFKWRPNGDGLLHVKSPNHRLVYEMRPNARLNPSLATNSYGFRDHEFSQAKAPDIFRITVVGDSVTFGWYEELQETFPKVLEAMLNHACAETPRFEAYNMGVGGYNAEQELEAVRAKALPLDPDLIVVQYCANDGLVGEDSGLWRHFFPGRLRTLDFLKLRWMRLREKYARENMVFRSYRKLNALSQETGIPILVIVLPMIGDDEGLANATYAFVRKLGLPAIDLAGPFEQLGMKTVMLFDGLHLNPIGHRIVAEEIYDYLQRDFAGENVPWCGGHDRLSTEREAFRAGLALQEAGDIDGALEAYQAAAELGPIHAHLVSLALGKANLVLMRQDRTDKAIEVARQAVALDSQSGEARRKLGVSLAAAGDIDGALQALENAIDLGGRHVAILADLGGIMTFNDDLEAALDVCREAIAIDATYAGLSAEWLAKAGNAFLQEGQPHKALARYHAAIELQPDNPWFRAGVGAALAQLGDFARAVDAYREANASGADCIALAANILGEAAGRFREQGDWERTKEGYQAAAVFEPENPWFRMDYGAALEKLGDQDAALHAYRQALALEPSSLAPYYRIDGILDRDNLADARLEQWRETRRTYPTAAPAHLYLGKALVAQGKRKEAVAALLDACDLAPSGAEVLAEAGRELVQLGACADAIEPLQAALRMSPAEHAVIRPALIAALIDIKDYDGAWREVAACRDKGVALPPDLLRRLQTCSGRDP